MGKNKDRVNVCWFRRDLRLDDNAALYHALKGDNPVVPLFVFDTNILDELEPHDARVQFIYENIIKIHQQLRQRGSSFKIIHATPADAFAKLMEEFDVAEVYTNSDYEPYAVERDNKISNLLAAKGVALHSFKDQVIFEKSEIVKDDGSPYVVFSPFSRRWKEKLTSFYLRSYPCEKYYDKLHQFSCNVPALSSLGFQHSEIAFPPAAFTDQQLVQYEKNRNFPAADGTSRLGVHLRFGTISIRKLVNRVRAFSEVYLNELIWREFYMMIMWQFPKVGKGHAFKNEYDQIVWRNNEKEFSLWCEGKTGYPLVDAGMRQLKATGFMHNRLRMVTASFLSKHLLIDWRWGEAYFAARLLDYEFASNNGGWQWAAGCGCDAAPYFRIFNPTLQAKKFDPRAEFISKWVPEINSFAYPKPLVDHEYARKRCLEVFGRIYEGGGGEK